MLGKREGRPSGRRPRPARAVHPRLQPLQVDVVVGVGAVAAGVELPDARRAHRVRRRALLEQLERAVLRRRGGRGGVGAEPPPHAERHQEAEGPDEQGGQLRVRRARRRPDRRLADEDQEDEEAAQHVDAAEEAENHLRAEKEKEVSLQSHLRVTCMYVSE